MKIFSVLVLINILTLASANGETAKNFLNEQILTTDGKSLCTPSKDVKIGLLSEENSWAASARHSYGGNNVFATSSVAPAFFSRVVPDGQWTLTHPDTSDFADWQQM